MRAAKRAGGKVAITLSDPFCVERHRGEFLRMIRADVDLLVANEHELMSLYETGDLEAAMGRAQAEIPVTACTVGAEGAHILAGEARVHAPATAVTVVDATGAGDLFAAGFLHGLTTRARLADLGADGLPRGGRGDLPRRRAARGRPRAGSSPTRGSTERRRARRGRGAGPARATTRGSGSR